MDNAPRTGPFYFRLVRKPTRTFEPDVKVFGTMRPKNSNRNET